MKRIDRKVLSFGRDGELRRMHTVDVAASAGHPVPNFEALVHAVSTVSFANPSYTLFYRGQGSDHRSKAKGDPGPISAQYPTMFRGALGTTAAMERERVRRFDELGELEQALWSNWQGSGRGNVGLYHEVRWALLQHYGMCPTPLLDVSQSLRVAASFAVPQGRGAPLRNAREAYVYAFGLPAVSGSISYCTDEHLVMVRLSSVCPPKAKRPHFQEGYLVGDFPLQARAPIGHNLAYRMLAKFRIPTKGFWSSAFPAVPWPVLIPQEDATMEFFRDISQAAASTD